MELSELPYELVVEICLFATSDFETLVSLSCVNRLFYSVLRGELSRTTATVTTPLFSSEQDRLRTELPITSIATLGAVRRAVCRDKAAYHVSNGLSILWLLLLKLSALLILPPYVLWFLAEVSLSTPRSYAVATQLVVFLEIIILILPFGLCIMLLFELRLLRASKRHHTFSQFRLQGHRELLGMGCVFFVFLLLIIPLTETYLPHLFEGGEDWVSGRLRLPHSTTQEENELLNVTRHDPDEPSFLEVVLGSNWFESTDTHPGLHWIWTFLLSLLFVVYIDAQRFAPRFRQWRETVLGTTWERRLTFASIAMDVLYLIYTLGRWRVLDAHKYVWCSVTARSLLFIPSMTCSVIIDAIHVRTAVSPYENTESVLKAFLLLPSSICWWYLWKTIHFQNFVALLPFFALTIWLALKLLLFHLQPRTGLSAFMGHEIAPLMLMKPELRNCWDVKIARFLSRRRRVGTELLADALLKCRYVWEESERLESKRKYHNFLLPMFLNLQVEG